MHLSLVLLLALCITLHIGVGAKATAKATRARAVLSKASRRASKRRSSSSSAAKIETVQTEAVIEAKAEVAPAQSKTVFSRLDPKNPSERVLTYYGLMLAGAVARSASATAVHPLNVIKTLLQTKGGTMPAMKWSVLSRGAGSQLIMSIPHGALSFVVTETTKVWMARVTQNSTLSRVVPPHLLNPLLDFLSSSTSTFLCSVVSTPQMVVTDRIMAGVYPHFLSALHTIASTEGLRGFYRGWLPALVQKIPSYALTWMFFQQLKL
ncbi:mitochondrial carrier domain-containing protein, partial [Ochromonadaceae sp. CCMP2298]